MRTLLPLLLLAVSGCVPTSNLTSGADECFGHQDGRVEPDSGTWDMSIGDDSPDGDWRMEVVWADVDGAQSAWLEFLACFIDDAGTETFTYAGGVSVDPAAGPYSDVALDSGSISSPGAVQGALQRTVDGDQDRFNILPSDDVSGTVHHLDGDLGEAHVSISGTPSTMSDVEAEDGTPSFTAEFDVTWTP